MVELDYEMLELGPGGASLLAGWKLRLPTTTRLVSNRMNTKLESEAYNVVRFVGMSDEKFLRIFRVGAFQVQIRTNERVRELVFVLSLKAGGTRRHKICADVEFFSGVVGKCVAASGVGR